MGCYRAMNNELGVKYLMSFKFSKDMWSCVKMKTFKLTGCSRTSDLSKDTPPPLQKKKKKFAGPHIS